MKITIIGAGNGGQAMAGHFAMLGHEVKLYNRNLKNIRPIFDTNEIALSDKITGIGKVSLVTEDLGRAISGAELIMITTVATAHKEMAAKMATWLEEGQTIVLNPGRTYGALEFYNEITLKTNKNVYIGEAQSLIYACRADTPGHVRIIGIKEKVLFTAYPPINTDFVLEKVNSVYPCFIKANNILKTSFENIGAILHPPVIIFNAAAIERGDLFYFYNDMTPSLAGFLEQIDKERLAIGKAMGIDLLSLFEWVSYAYQKIEGDNLLERMRNNPAYHKILAPNTLHSRLLLEDIPTGILPMTETAKILNVEVPLMNAVLEITESLLKIDFRKTGRTKERLKLCKDSIDRIINQETF